MVTSDSAALSYYRTEIRRRVQLAPAIEVELADRCKNGDRDAARRLVEACLSAVVAIAYEYRRCGLPLEDLVQEGNIGLLKSVERFDPRRGLRLSSYAGYWIRAEIRAYVVRHYRIVKLGTTKGEHRAVWLYRRTREERAEELAAMSGLSTERVNDLLPLLMANNVSLSVPPGDGAPDPLSRLRDHAQTAEEMIGDVEERDHLRATVSAIVAELSQRDQDIVVRRLLAEDPATLEQIGETWGVSKERVRQLEAALKVRLRQRLERIAAT